MFSYYTAVILLSWMALFALGVLITENDRIPAADKKLLYSTYLLIALSAFAEWCGVLLNGKGYFSNWPLRLAKCADYILTPMAGGAIVMQLRIRNRLYRAMLGLLAVNTVMQVVSLFFGWMVKVNENGQYMHGPLYPAYLILTLVVLTLVIIEFLIYGKAFPKRKRTSLYVILLMILTGVFIQEICGGTCRVAYLSLAFGVCLLFIHYTEYSLQTMDSHLAAQQVQIDTDALTGLYSRHAYSLELKKFRDGREFPPQFAVFVIDINGLKQVNDRIGHEAGDELILGAAACIQNVFGSTGKCFRTGGDEFVVFARMSKEAADNALQSLEQETGKWKGESVDSLNLAAGYSLAGEYEDLAVEKLVEKADQEMYAAKAAYYRSAGIDRRRR